MKFKKIKNESTRKLVKEGAGAGYEIEIKDVKIDKVIKFEESDYKSKYSSEKWYKYEATIKPGEYDIDASTYYDSLVHDYDNNVVIESGTIYGEIGIWEDENDERSLEEKIRDEIEGNKHTIKTMYGAGWLHAYLPKDGNIEFDKITDYTPDDCLYTIEQFKFKSPDMAYVINYNYDHIGEDDDNDELDEIDESNMKFKKIKNESTEEELENDKEYGSKPSPIEIDYKKKELRELMEHLMKAEDELFTFIQTGKRLVRNDKDGGYENLEYCIHCAENAIENISDTKIQLRDIQ